MEIYYKSLIFLLIVVISLTGCKKSQEELAKELEIQKKQEIAEVIDSVYDLGGGGHLSRLVDKENYEKLNFACFDFKPKLGKAIIKYYNFPNRYEVRVEAINELEYKLSYNNKEAQIKLETVGDFPVKKGSMTFFGANAQLKLPNDSNVYPIGRMDLIYGGESVSRSRHGRFNTLEECEAQIAADEELSKSLREQKSTCEGPGC